MARLVRHGWVGPLPLAHAASVSLLSVLCVAARVVVCSGRVIPIPVFVDFRLVTETKRKARPSIPGPDWATEDHNLIRFYTRT